MLCYNTPMTLKATSTPEAPPPAVTRTDLASQLRDGLGEAPASGEVESTETSETPETDAEQEEVEDGEEPEPEPESEEDEEGETDEHEHEHEDDGEESGFTPEQQAVIDKRIGRELKKQKARAAELDQREAALEARAAALEARENQAPPPPPPSAAMLADDEDGLDARVAELRQGIRWCRDNADGYFPDDESEPSIDADQVRKHLAALEDELDLEVPKARRRLPLRQEAREQAVEKYPDVFKAGTPANKIYDDLLAEVPELRRRTDYPLLVAAFAAEQTGQQPAGSTPAKAKGGKKRAVKPPPPPGAPGSTSAPARKALSAEQKPRSAARERIQRGNLNHSDLKDVLKAL